MDSKAYEMILFDRLMNLLEVDDGIASLEDVLYKATVRVRGLLELEQRYADLLGQAKNFCYDNDGTQIKVGDTLVLECDGESKKYVSGIGIFPLYKTHVSRDGVLLNPNKWIVQE